MSAPEGNTNAQKPRRLNHLHAEQVRQKIQATQLIKRLTACAMGEVELSTTQVKAIEILLKKSVPDLSSIQLTGADGGPLVLTWQG